MTKAASNENNYVLIYATDMNIKRFCKEILDNFAVQCNTGSRDDEKVNLIHL